MALLMLRMVKQMLPRPIPTGNVTTNLVNTQDIPLEKVRVGDIEMAYKMFGKGDPIDTS